MAEKCIICYSQQAHVMAKLNEKKVGKNKENNNCTFYKCSFCAITKVEPCKRCSEIILLKCKKCKQIKVPFCRLCLRKTQRHCEMCKETIRYQCRNCFKEKSELRKCIKCIKLK